jgi:hypothetical protein
MSSGGFRSVSLSTNVEITIEVLPLATHKSRHYLYAVLYAVVYYLSVKYIFFNPVVNALGYPEKCVSFSK